MNCDFVGNDIANANIPGELCSTRCRQTPGCSHYSWTSFQDGTCWMKTGNVTSVNATLVSDETAMCGFL